MSDGVKETRAEFRLRQEQAAAELVDVALAAAIAAIKTQDDKMTRAATIAYGIALDKVLLLSGEATRRTETRDLSRLSAEELEDRSKKLRNDLLARRKERGEGKAILEVVREETK